jgi:hypothetical protein
LETNEYNEELESLDNEKERKTKNTLSSYSSHSGKPKGSDGLHAKHPSAISKHLKMLGIDWIKHFGDAIQQNDVELLSLWVKILPYLIVTGGHRQTSISRKWKGKASKAALMALESLENG